MICGTFTRGFTPGCYIPGFQPFRLRPASARQVESALISGSKFWVDPVRVFRVVRGSSRPGDEHHAEAEVGIGLVRGTEEPRGRPAIVVGIVVSAAAHDFLAELKGTGRPGRIGLNAARLIAIPILAPFPDMPVHVVDSPRIGKFLPDRVND